MPNTIDSNVITGALAIIKVNGVAIGKMRDIRVNENFRRVRVPKGLGSIFADEFALVEWAGTISCSFYEISYGKTGLTDHVDVACSFYHLLLLYEFGHRLFHQLLQPTCHPQNQ